jgi:hypothetical protein
LSATTWPGQELANWILAFSYINVLVKNPLRFSNGVQQKPLFGLETDQTNSEQLKHVLTMDRELPAGEKYNCRLNI